MSTYQVQSRGIYHGLPVYPSSVQNLTAIITGANGISGYYMLQALSQFPHRWSQIYCLSRRPPLIPGGLPDNATHIALDFLNPAEEIASVLTSQGVKADYIFFFFYSYIQPPPKAGGSLWSDADETGPRQRAPARELPPLSPAGRHRPPARAFMLQTGAKNYGGHLGPTKLPQEESDPRVLLGPNFYYDQEDLLFPLLPGAGRGVDGWHAWADSGGGAGRGDERLFPARGVCCGLSEDR